MCIKTRHGVWLPRAATPCTGFTLIELVIAIVVLSVGLAGILLVFNQAVARSADPMLQQQAIAVAEGYMEEIIGKTCAVAPTATGTRAEWDEVQDYDGLDDSPPKDIQGNLMSGLEGFRVRVAVNSGTLNGVSGCRITVTATHNADARVQAELVGWRMGD